MGSICYARENSPRAQVDFTYGTAQGQEIQTNVAARSNPMAPPPVDHGARVGSDDVAAARPGPPG